MALTMTAASRASGAHGDVDDLGHAAGIDGEVLAEAFHGREGAADQGFGRLPVPAGLLDVLLVEGPLQDRRAADDGDLGVEIGLIERDRAALAVEDQPRDDRTDVDLRHRVVLWDGKQPDRGDGRDDDGQQAGQDGPLVAEDR